MTEQFNKAEYIVHFNSVFTNNKMGKAFSDFLETEHNTEPWNFLQEVAALNGVTDNAEQLKKIKGIFAKYIEDKATYEINISGELKDATRNKMKQQETTGTANGQEVFKDCYNLVSNLLLHDSFKRFVRTVECEAVMKQFKHDKTVVSPAITNNFSYDDAFFSHPFFRDRDFEFFISLFQDSYDWELIGSKITESTNAYVSAKNLLPDLTIVENPRCSKYESFFPCTFDQAILSYFDNEQLYKSDPNCGKFETFEYYSYEDLLEIKKKNGKEDENKKFRHETSVNRLELKLPFPFDPRVGNCSVATYYDKEKERVIRLTKTFQKEGESWCAPMVRDVTLKRGGKTQKKKCFAILLYSCGMYTKLDENRVLYQEININQFGGWVDSNMMFKAITKDRKDKFRSQMLKLALDLPADVKVQNQKDVLLKLVDGTMNGLGNSLYHVMTHENKEESKPEQVNGESENVEVKAEQIETIETKEIPNEVQTTQIE